MHHRINDYGEQLYYYPCTPTIYVLLSLKVGLGKYMWLSKKKTGRDNRYHSYHVKDEVVIWIIGIYLNRLKKMIIQV